jgi:D-beta-D-heptose 7-phosphate kinase/D-beta-D-heptose 1-phosphate adenosyltransferase
MRLLVIGDSCTDRFVYGICERICPEAPVPVFNPSHITENGGMAKNVHSNVEALGIECDLITHSNEILKTRYIDDKTNQMLLRVDEDDSSVEKFDYQSVEYKRYDAILVSDYNKGFLDNHSIRNVCQYHDNVFWDTKREMKYDLPANLTMMKVNQYEIESNWSFKHVTNQKTNGDSHYNRPDQIVVTYGNKGCKYMGKMYAPEKVKEVRDVSGAGDTFFAALAISITKGGVSMADSLAFANKCASEVVSKRGVVTL